jgi:cyanate permease
MEPKEQLNLASLPSPAESAEPSQTSYRRWVILALVWLLYASHGIVLRSPSPLVTPMLRDLDMSYGQMGFVLGSWQLSYMGVAVVAGIILDRWGLRKSLFFGSVVISLSAALRYFAQGFGTLLPMVALFGVGGPMISIGAPKAISVFFKGRDRGTAIGIYSTGPWIGQMLVLAATNAIVMPLTGYNWRLTFACYGLFTFGAALLWWVFARNASQVEGTGFNFNRIIRRLLSVYNVRIILMAGPLLFAILHGFAGWLPKLLENSGITPTMAGLLSALPFLTGIPAILILPRLIPPYLRGRFIALLVLLGSVAILLIATRALPLPFSLLLYGIAQSSLVPLFILVLMETPEIGPEYMGSAGGLFFCISEIGGFLGPFAVGVLVDLTGTFLAGAVFLTLLGAAILALMCLLRPQAVSDLKAQ